LVLLDFMLLAVSSIAAVMEPFSTAAVFATLTKDMNPEKKRRIIRRSMSTSFVVLALFAVTGHLIFRVFGITVPAFQIADGILLVSVAIDMLNPKKSQTSSPARA